MLGLGYGLGKMGEGVASGMLKGKLTTMGLDEREKNRRVIDDTRNRALDIEERRVVNQEEQVQIQRSTSALLSSYQMAVKSPTPAETFKAVYPVFDPEGEIPEVDFQGDTMSLNYEGFKIKGRKAQMLQAMQIINKAPGKISEVLEKLVQTGLAEIDIPEKKAPEGKNVSVPPGHTLVDEQGKPIYTAPPASEKPKSAREKITTMEHAAWVALFKGTATPEQKRLLKLDRDPLVAGLLHSVNNQYGYQDLPYEQKALKAMEMAEMMREAKNAASFKKMIPEYNPEGTGAGGVKRGKYDPDTDEIKYQ